MSRDWKKLRVKALIAAKLRGADYASEDIAQDVMVSYLEEKAETSTVSQRTVDALRRHFGRPDTPRKVTMDKIKFAKEAKCGDFQTTDSTAAMAAGVDVHKMLTLVDGLDRAILILHYMWGMENQEIAYVFGISEGRVSQLSKAALLEIQTLTRKRELRGAYR